jgi:hypothetical protein
MIYDKQGTGFQTFVEDMEAQTFSEAFTTWLKNIGLDIDRHGDDGDDGGGAAHRPRDIPKTLFWNGLLSYHVRRLVSSLGHLNGLCALLYAW